MMVLDLDLDFFLTDCCPLAKKGERPCSDAAKPWDEAAVTDYLERHLGLSKSHPIPGIITQTHDGALPFWQTRMERGLLTRPFSVVHIDAHADLGIGKPGPGIVLNGVLGIDPKIRDRFSRYYENRQLDEANYLLFALAFRWINALTLVRDPFSRPDLPPFCERTEHGWQPIRLRSFISELMETQYGPEPQIPLKVFDDPFSYAAEEPFSCMNLAHSPRYAPKEADALISLIAQYMDLVPETQACYNM